MNRIATAPAVRRVSTVARTACAALVSALLVTGCGADDEDGDLLAPPPQPNRRVLVLDGFIQPGMTFLADTGSASTKITFGPSTEFDAGGFTLERDTVLAVSSRGAGNLLYVMGVADGAVLKVPMPANSNPGRARLLRGSNGRALVGVALRDQSTIALVSLRSASDTVITRIQNAGTCPTDVFQYDNATWIVDANANCRVNYAVQGDARIIRVPNTGTARDTIVLAGVRGSSVGAIVQGDVAYLAAGGEADFSRSPFRSIAGGTVTKVDLRTRRVLQQRAMPAGSFGASTKLGLDGFLYVSLSQDLVAFTSRVLKLRTDDLSVVAPSGGATPWLALTSAAGTDATCGGATADRLGRLHCIVNGAGSATSLLVFDVAGREIRRTAAGQGGVDLALR